MRSRCRGLAALALGLFALAAPLSAQKPTESMSRPYPAPPQLCQQFDVLAATVQHIEPFAAANGDVAVGVEFGGVAYHLALVPVDVRSPSFRLMVRDAAGLHQEPTPRSVTYQGTVLEDPASVAAATIFEGAVTALVRLGDGSEWVIQQVRSVQPTAGAPLHIVFRRTDNAPLPWSCGTPGALTGPVPTLPSISTAYIAELACEADFPLFQFNASSVLLTQNDVTGIVNAMSTIYQSNVQIQFTITQIVVNTVADPYSTSVAGTLLTQFRNNWNATHGAIQRDVAHLFTGRPVGATSGGVIGIALTSTTCNLGAAYSLSETHWTNNFAARVAVTAHEIGHNFGAGHCDATPPCNIMCSGLGGCSGNITSFSTNERNQIIAYANSVSCLQVAPTPPVIAALSPSQVTAFQPGVMQITGTGFTGVTQLHIGSTTMNGGFIVASDTVISVTLPTPTALGTVPVTVTNAAATSNAANLTINARIPCELSAPQAVLGGTNLFWSFGGHPSDVWLLLVSGVNTSTPFLGWPVLNGADIIALGFLDPAVGLGNYTVPVPLGTFAGVTAYSQIVELQLGAPSLTIDSSSSIRSTFVVN